MTIELGNAHKELRVLKKKYPNFVFFVSKKTTTMDEIAKQLNGDRYEDYEYTDFIEGGMSDDE